MLTELTHERHNVIFAALVLLRTPKGIKEERIPEIHGIRRPLEFITAVHCAGEDGKTCKQFRLAQSQLRSAVAAHGSARDKVILPFL